MYILSYIENYFAKQGAVKTKELWFHNKIISQLLILRGADRIKYDPVNNRKKTLTLRNAMKLIAAFHTFILTCSINLTIDKS